MNGPWSHRAEPETNMEFSQQAYDALEKGDDHMMTTEEMDLLADEANELIAEGESDQNDPACLLVTAESPAWKGP